jgi:hypothetical protein
MSHAQQLHHRRYLNDYPEIINRQGLPGQLQNDLCLQVQATVSAPVQHLIEATLEEERIAYLGLDRYAHMGWGRPPEATRSGSYRREWLTQYSRIADLHVPKLRRGNGALSWQSMTRYEHRWRPLLDQQVLSYCLGHRLRDWQETMAWSRSEVLQLLACNCMVARVAPDLERGASEADIRQRAETFRETWDDREPNAVANFGVDVDQTLVSCGCIGKKGANHAASFC